MIKILTTLTILATGPIQRLNLPRVHCLTVRSSCLQTHFCGLVGGGQKSGQSQQTVPAVEGEWRGRGEGQYLHTNLQTHTHTQTGQHRSVLFHFYKEEDKEIQISIFLMVKISAMHGHCATFLTCQKFITYNDQLFENLDFNFLNIFLAFIFPLR